MKGLYVHVPFCIRKCNYCDFYSVVFGEALADRYTAKIRDEIMLHSDTFDTLYLGGGTPSLLQSRIGEIITPVKLSESAEVTLECNPGDHLSETLQHAAAAGVNRISIGLQSAIKDELTFLTRRHTTEDVTKAIRNAREAGLHNISLDVIIGVQGQDVVSLRETLDFCIAAGVTHISAYLLKIEEGTPFFHHRNSFQLPDEEAVRSLYLFCCEYLENHGYCQYEISNFAKSGYESRHNLIYWNCDEYWGTGPGAHSFWNGKRFYYPRNLDYFLEGNPPVSDGEGGNFNEYLMLRLRLTAGLNFVECKKRGFYIDPKIIDRAIFLSKKGLVVVSDDSISLTREGFLVQNQIILYLTD